LWRGKILPPKTNFPGRLSLIPNYLIPVLSLFYFLCSPFSKKMDNIDVNFDCNSLKRRPYE
jgi:hypothetical protein